MIEILDSLAGDFVNLLTTTAEAVAAAASDAGVVDAAQAAANTVADAAAAVSEATAAAATAAAEAAPAAADAAANAAPATAEAVREPTFLDSAKQFFEEGGHFMYVNVCSLSVALAVVIERTIRLMFTYHLNPGPFMEQISKLVAAGQIERAIKLCAIAPKAALARVVRAGLSKANQGEVEISKAMEEASMEVTPLIQNRVGSLWSLSNISVLIGLVGTILGLINAFKSLGAVAADKRSEVLSAGISEAMNNTAFGLSIAITCIVSHLLLSSRAKGMIEDIELCSMKVESMLARRSAALQAEMAQKAS